MRRSGCICAVAAILVGTPRATAQPVVDWLLVVDGESAAWPAEAPLPGDATAARQIALEVLLGRGYFNARVDSVVLRSDAGTAYARRGAVPLVGSVTVRGADGLEARAAEGLVGFPPESARIERAADRLLEALEMRGRPGSIVRLAGLAPDMDRMSVAVRFDVDPGPQVVLEGVLVQGAARTTTSLVEHLTGLVPGSRLSRFDPAGMAEALEESGLFSEVRPPVLLPSSDSTAIVQIVLQDAAPGSFDAALGYQPPTQGGAGRFVGSGRLALVNPFGGGRRFDVLIDRLPGQVSRAEVAASDPFFLSWPVQLDAEFSGLQQDSTFGRQRYRVEAGLRLARSLTLTVSGTRETARPGTAGLAIRNGRQLVARSDGLFAGVGIRYRVLDRASNPTRGRVVEVRFERGSYTRRTTAIGVEGDTTRISTRTRAERLTATTRVFVPVLERWVFVFGADASVLVSPAYERSDLFRLGGARSLRGYDEDRFEGSAAGRGLAEVRRLIDLRTYAFAFADLGFVDVPRDLGASTGLRLWPGYGFGLQLDTAAGLITATYGFNLDDGPANGRIHVAFSFGL